MIVGQLTFGLFGDALGRHKIYGKELVLTIVGTLLVIAAPTGLGHSGIVAWLTVFRIITGFGIGGGEQRPLWSHPDFLLVRRRKLMSHMKIIR